MARIAPGPTGRALVRAVRGLLDDPLPLLDELHATYGDVIELRAPTLRLVLLAHPTDIEQLLVGHARATSKGPTLERMQAGMGRNLFTLEGDAHDERRRLLTPIFRPRDIAPQAPRAVEQAEAESARWRDGDPVEVDRAMDDLVLAAMGQVMLGRPHGDEARQLAQLVHESVAMTPRLLDPSYGLRARLWPPYARPVRSLVDRWDSYCDALVDRARGEGAVTGDRPSDVLHTLLHGMGDGAAMLTDDRAIREELRGLLMSAHETTALALAWALHELAHEPDQLARACEQVDAELGMHGDRVGRELAASDLRQLPILRAAFEEALRLRGGTFVPRGALEDLPLDHAGVTIPAGHEVLASMWVTHRDARWWSEPEQFRPERFEQPDPNRPRFAWFPFGGGRRTCIGMHLAVQTGVLVLATILRDWRLEPLVGADRVEPVSNVLVRPKGPIRLVPRARSLAG